MDKGFFVKYTNKLDSIGTAKLHIQVLQKEGAVIWGQWTQGKSILSEKTYQTMNKHPFYLYALDKNAALLKMKVEKVFRKEEVSKNKLEYLIPSYYSLETNKCIAYFLIKEIEIFPVEESKKILAVNGKHSSIYNSQQVAMPWQVYESKPLCITQEENKNNKEQKNVNDESLLLKIEDYKQQIKELQNKIKILQDNLSQSLKSSERTYVVYDYYSKTMNKHYIGMTKDINRRRREHETPSNWKNSKKYLYTMFSLLSVSDFDFSILHSNLTENEAHYWEAKEIQNHNAYYPNGFNERDESRYLNNKIV